MSIIPSPRPSFDDATPACVPGCVVDHRDPMADGSDGAFYCRTAAEPVACGTSLRGVLASAAVATDRCLISDPADADLATAHRVTLAVPDRSTSYTPAAARALAWSLLARADLIERAS